MVRENESGEWRFDWTQILTQKSLRDSLEVRTIFSLFSFGFFLFYFKPVVSLSFVLNSSILKSVFWRNCCKLPSYPHRQGLSLMWFYYQYTRLVINLSTPPQWGTISGILWCGKQYELFTDKHSGPRGWHRSILKLVFKFTVFQGFYPVEYYPEIRDTCSKPLYNPSSVFLYSHFRL
jgi:hypothetical protein